MLRTKIQLCARDKCYFVCLIPSHIYTPLRPNSSSVPIWAASQPMISRVRLCRPSLMHAFDTNCALDPAPYQPANSHRNMLTQGCRAFRDKRKEGKQYVYHTSPGLFDARSSVNLEPLLLMQWQWVTKTFKMYQQKRFPPQRTPRENSSQSHPGLMSHDVCPRWKSHVNYKNEKIRK